MEVSGAYANSRPFQETSPTNLSIHHSSGQQASPGTSSVSINPALHGDNTGGEDSRFVGDLNPESIFLAATSPSSTHGAGESDRVGVWLSRRVMESITSTQAMLALKQSHSNSLYAADPMISTVLVPYLGDQCLRLLPKSADFEGLSDIYFKEVHPIFPVLDEESFQALQEGSPAKVLLKQAICLAASTNKRTTKLLNLSTGSTACHKDFAEQTSQAIQTSINLGLVKDELVLIQVLALLSFFTQLSDNRHSSAELAARAISYAHTVGLHLQTNTSRKDHIYVTRLFCCIWALDRLNAAFHGRPVLMHERDFGRNLESCFQQQEGCFQLLLRTVSLLDKVIELYRPMADGSEVSWESDFPTFEELLLTSGALRVKSHLLGAY